MIDITIRLELPDLVTPQRHTFSISSSTSIHALRCHISSIVQKSNEQLNLYALLGERGDADSKKTNRFACLEKMDDETATVAYYGLSSGDEVVVRSL